MKNKEYIILNSLEDFKPENIVLGVPHIVDNDKNTLYSEIRYRNNKQERNEKRNKQLYIQTPTLVIGNIESNNIDTNKIYLDLCLMNTESNKQKNIQRFKDRFNQLDLYLTRKIWETRNYWNIKGKNVPLSEIEHRYFPSLEISHIAGMHSCLRFEIPRDFDTLDIDIFDEDNEELPVDMIKPEYTCKGLILVKGLIKVETKFGDYYRLDMKLKQLKVNIPEIVFENCQLSDSEEESSDFSIDSLE